LSSIEAEATKSELAELKLKVVMFKLKELEKRHQEEVIIWFNIYLI